MPKANPNHLTMQLPTIILILYILVVTPRAEAALGCNDVVQSLMPCLGYFQGGGVGKVPGQCCAGIGNLNTKANNTLDRRAACKCLKDTANALKNVNIGLAASIPSRCGIKIAYKLDPSTDCAKIN